MSRRRNRDKREPSRNPWTACLYGVLWAPQEPLGLLAPAPASHSFRFPVHQVEQFGKLRSIERTAVQNFIRVDGAVYRIAFLSQTRAARTWIRIHVARCRCPKLELPEGGRRLQVTSWIDALQPGDVSAEELMRDEPLLPSDEIRNFS